MSRWAEMFASLSEGHDTVDTVDTVAGTTDAAPTVSQSVNSVKAPERAEGFSSLAADEQPLVDAIPSAHDTSAPLLTEGRANALSEPTLLRDGRRLHRFRATAIPDAIPAEIVRLMDEARWRGVVLVADGHDLVVVEPWLRMLSDEVLADLRWNPGGIIAALLGETRRRA
jgi:hypothetical protein